MKRITINNKEYTIEYSIEATLHNEAVETVMDMMLESNIVQTELENSNASETEKIEMLADAFKKNISNMPQKALTLFYTGLLEHHGASGDGSILCEADAKKLLSLYIKENDDVTLYDVLNDMINQMAEDHFFDMIGVEKMVNNATPKKTPQDHKRKAKSGEK